MNLGRKALLGGASLAMLVPASMTMAQQSRDADQPPNIVLAQASDALPEVIVEQREARRRRAVRTRQARPQPRPRVVQARRVRPAPVVVRAPRPSPDEIAQAQAEAEAQAQAAAGAQGAANDYTPAGEVDLGDGPTARALEQPGASASVISDRQIEQQGQSNSYEALIGAPNITPAPAGGQFLPPIRGETTDGPAGSGGLGGGILTNTSPSAPIIVDDVARISSYANANFQGVNDVDYVAVLRGPQLFLPGALGFSGAYIVKTNDPVYTPEASAFGEITSNDISGETYRGGAMINAPIVADQLAVRMTAEYEDGKSPFIVRGASPEAQALFGLPTVPEGTDLDALNEFDAIRLRGKVLAEPKAIPGLSILFQGEYEEGTDQAFESFVNNELITGRPVEDRIYAFGLQRIFDIESETAIINAAYELGSHTEIRSISSYVRDLFETNPLSNEIDLDFDTIEQERRAQDFILTFGPNDKLNGVAGVTLTELDRFSEILGFPVSQDTNTVTQAAYVNLSIPVRPSWWLLAGGRVHHYENDIDQAIFGSPLLFQEETTRVLPKVGVQYDLSKDAHITATAAKGWNPGAAAIDFSTLQSYEFQDEKRWTYELAYTRRWSDRLNFTATGFYNDFEDKQFSLTLPTLQTLILNQPKAESYGAEFELKAGLRDDLDISAGLGLVHTEITEITPETQPDIKGNSFGLDPRVTTALGLAWRPINGLELTGKVVYVAEYFGNFTEFPFEISGDYTLLDLGASYTWRNLTARAFVNNVTDEFAIYQELGPDSGPYVLPPRTYGASLKVAF